MVGKDGKWEKRRSRLGAKARAALEAEEAARERRLARDKARRQKIKHEGQRRRVSAKAKARRKAAHYATCFKLNCRWCAYYHLPEHDDRPPVNPSAKRRRPRMGPLASHLRWPDGDPFGGL